METLGRKGFMGRQIAGKLRYLITFMRAWGLLVIDGDKYRLTTKDSYGWPSRYSWHTSHPQICTV